MLDTTKKETGYTALRVTKETKDRLDKLLQELGIQGTEDQKLSLLIDKYYQLAEKTTEKPQP